MKLPLLHAAGAMASAMASSNFNVETDGTTGALLSIRNPKVNSSMNWVSSFDNAPWQPLGSKWGLGYADLGADLLHRTYWNSPKSSNTSTRSEQHLKYNMGPVELTVSRTVGDTLTETYTFRNVGNESLDLAGARPEALAIYTPFNDHYTNTTDALKNRAHAHVWANGGQSAWVKMDQMGGHGRNLGLVVTEGSLGGYSIDSRDPVTLSNTRGVFLLHPSIPELKPGESGTVAWTLFWHDDWPDFFDKCANHSQQFINMNVSDYTLIQGENVSIDMTGGVDEDTSVNGEPVDCVDGVCTYVHHAEELGEQTLQIESATGNSTIYFNTVPELDTLIEARTKFIMEKQQIKDPNETTHGSYVVFDTQSQTPAFWETRSDTNAGRERVGMGILMSRWLRKHPDNQAVRESLLSYYSWVSLQLQEEDGYVLNKPGLKDADRQRLYNWPWVLQLHISVARLGLELTGPVAEKTPVERFMTTLENFYSEGGGELYAIGLPVLESLRYLEEAGETTHLERAKELFIAHGEYIVQRGLDYPPFEVNFEQSIVAPAAIMMGELYRYTGNDTWLEALELQLETLLRFEGKQPDYRLHHVAIRHWDGYWFGKDRLWGDTFPHHWSTIDALALHHYGKATGDDSALKRAQSVIRANLALFEPNGEASCAWIYPLTVNGREAYKKDPYANDQDWVLNHLLYLEEDENAA